MTIDKAKLRAAAEAAGPKDYFAPRPYEEDRHYDDQELKRLEFMAEADPATVLALLAEIERHEAWRTAFLAERDAQMRQRDQLKAESEALRSAAMAAREFIMHEAEVRGLLDENGQVSHRHPRRQAAIAKIDAAMAKEASHG